MFRRALSVAVLCVALIGIQPAVLRAEALRCPYRFDSVMPADTFCVYRGVARAQDGRVCDSDLVIIWSGFKDADKQPSSVYLGVIGDEELVLHANVDTHDADGMRADVTAFTGTGRDTPGHLRGAVNLRPSASATNADKLELQLSDAHLPADDDCQLSEYSGKFMGVIGPTAETAQVSY